MHEIVVIPLCAQSLCVIMVYGNGLLTIRIHTQDALLLIKGKIGLRTKTHTPVAHCPDAATVRDAAICSLFMSTIILTT